MRIPFSKYEGIGNDFVLVDQPEAISAVGPDQAIAICDRHLGVGADGVLLVSTGRDGASMRVLNADGSSPEMCGNGLRCVALHLASTGELGPEITVQTDAGPHLCSVRIEDTQAPVGVAMAVPSLLPADIPVDAKEPLIDAKLDVTGVGVHITAISMGNPHAVTFDVLGERRLQLGPALESHSRFTRGCNAGFAQLKADGSMELHVFERGVGWTRACGTGACAAAVAAVETGRCKRGEPIAVVLPGGTLSITVGEPGERVHMRGPARLVFTGQLEI